MRFTVDPWDPAYGTSLETDLDASDADVNTDLEVPAAEWLPVPPVPGPVPAAVLFVDGVRRIDAQVWVDTSSPALCASYAAGVVCCCADGAHLLAAPVRRGLVTTAAGATAIRTPAGTYEVVAAQESSRPPAQVLSQALQNALDRAELEAAATARGQRTDGDDLLVVDGPLRGRQHLPRAIGFVKSHRSGYLPPELGDVVARLAPGERTPVFTVGSSWVRHTWYLRLPGGSDAPWAGVVRVECGGALPAAEAVTLASLSQRVLPRHASTPYKDSRAPQNLYPIAGLERGLRRRLGEPAVLYRALLRAAS